MNRVQDGRENKELRGGSGTYKCYACGKAGHFARDEVCPARGKTCAKCGKKGHWVVCCRSGTESKRGGRVRDWRASGGTQRRSSGVNQVEYDSGDEPFAFPVNFNGERACEDNVVTVKINSTTTNMLVDSGAQSTVLGERQFNNLVKSGLRAKLQPEERNLRVYGNGRLPVVGRFEAIIECHGRKTMETILVTQGEGRCLLGSPAAKRLQVLQVGPELEGMAKIYSVGSDIESMVDRFPKVFSGVGQLSGYQLKLHIDQDVKPVAQKPRRIPYPLKDKVTRKIDELLDLDIIEKVSGPTTWVSPAVFAPKPNKDDVRICVDMRRANEAIQREKLPIPTVDEVLEELNGSTVFSKLDMNMGFHQIELEEGSRDITTFSAGDSLFRYKRLSFGVNSAPEQYQHIIRQTIAGCPGATNIADDIVVHGKTTEEHDKNLVILLDRLQERNLTLNKDKCNIGMNQIVFMGLLLNKHGVGPTEEKVRAIRETEAPTNVVVLRSFLGLLSFSSRFLPDFATTVEPLRKLTRQGTKWHWGKEENEAFEALKNQLAEASMMAFYDKNAPTEVVTDASPVGLGAILVQEKQGVKRAVAFASRSLSEVERRYSQTEKEALAVVWACERFHLYLSGLESFQLVTDCKALEVIYGPRSKPSARVERWVLRLMPFKYTVRHVSSSQNIADCLSRLTKIPASHHDSVTEEYVRMVAVGATPRAMTTREIERASAVDEELTEVYHCWKTGNWSAAPSPYRLLRDEITVVGRLVMRGMRIVVPVTLRERVLELAHEGHQGIVKTKDRLRSKVWWPNMNSMVERHCKKCLGCQAVTPVTTTPPVKTTTMPTKPWRDLAVDLMGPLPTGESLLVTVDYYSRWIEVDVVRNTASSVIIKCLEHHFTRHGIPETLRTDNGSNLVSHEMEEFLDELGIKHKRTIPLWPRANGEVERQNKSLLKAMRAAQAEGKPWQKELQKYLLAYRSTPHTTTGVSPAELLYGRKIRTKMPEFESYEEEERSATIDQQARDQDAEQKKRVAETANKRAAESDVAEGDKVLLLRRKQNKLSATYDPEPYSVVSKTGDLVVIARGDTQLKRNVAHVKRFVEPTPQASQPRYEGTQQPVTQPFVQQPATGSATPPAPEPVEILPQGPVAEPIEEPSPQPAVARVPEQTIEPRRSTRTRTEPSWLKDFVT